MDGGTRDDIDRRYPGRDTKNHSWNAGRHPNEKRRNRREPAKQNETHEEPENR